jgi:hypothetical protein
MELIVKWRSAACSAPKLARSATGIVIRNATAGSSSVPSCHIKKDKLEEEEWEQLPPELEEETWPWWVEHRELQATLSRQPDDLEH